MTIEEKLKIEDNRNDENINRVHFFREGNFYGAYNWSAYVAFNYRKDGKQLKISHCKLRSGLEYLTIGLPLSSFEKYFPNINFDIEEYKDKNYFYIDFNSIGVETYEESKPILSETFNNTEISHNRKKSDKKSNNIDSNIIDNNEFDVKDFGIITSLISFDIDNHSLEENIKFLKEIKSKAHSIINKMF